MQRVLRIGTRDSELAIWQAKQVQGLLSQNGQVAELVFIKSEGDLDLKTPLYEMGVQGIFTKSLDMALLNDRIDLAVHSMKDVPTKLPPGITDAAILKRGPVHDLLVYKNDTSFLNEADAHIATSSIRRKSQWLHRYPGHHIHNLRGNVNTRLKKLQLENWNAAIFAQAGLERINLRPTQSIVLDWMLPAPAQGAIMVVCREDDEMTMKACSSFNDAPTALCTKIEKDFLRELAGGCSTPISALAEIKGEKIRFRGNIFSIDGRDKVEVEKIAWMSEATSLGKTAAWEILENGGREIAQKIKYAG